MQVLLCNVQLDLDRARKSPKTLSRQAVSKATLTWTIYLGDEKRHPEDTRKPAVRQTYASSRLA